MEENRSRLTLIEDLGMCYPTKTSKQKKRYGMYKCACGTVKRFDLNAVKTNHTLSCGCINKEAKALKNKLIEDAVEYQEKLLRVSTPEVNLLDPLIKPRDSNGMYNHRLYQIWSGMIIRTTDPTREYYKYYGGIGVQVCDRWMSMKNFVDDMYDTYEEGLSIDRINTSGNYELSNCRWATNSTQSQNTKVLYVNNTSGYRGVSLNKQLGTWTARIGINNKTLVIGRYLIPLEAAKAYDTYVLENNLEHTVNGVLDKDFKYGK